MDHLSMSNNLKKREADIPFQSGNNVNQTANRGPKKKDNSIIGSVVILIIGGILLIIGLIELKDKSSYIFNDDVTPINQIISQEGSIEDYLNRFVSIDVDATLGAYGETKHKRELFGIIPITTRTDTHYIVWLDDLSFMSVVVSKATKEGMEDIKEQTYNFLIGQSDEELQKNIHIEGQLVSLGGKAKEAYDETFDELGISKENVRYYSIEETSKTEQLIFCIGELVIGTLLFLVSLASIITRIKKSRGGNRI